MTDNTFAKVFDIKEGPAHDEQLYQLLVFMTVDDNEDPCLKCVTSIDGLEVALSYSGTEDEIKLSFNRQTPDTARQIFGDLIGHLKSLQGKS